MNALHRQTVLSMHTRTPARVYEDSPGTVRPADNVVLSMNDSWLATISPSEMPLLACQQVAGASRAPIFWVKIAA